ncbi:MAG TPA: hypothetical protein VG650_06695 [Mycobacteriales bacterium]|nr:hypothetical protein [Mycobacteriales bacterium]
MRRRWFVPLLVSALPAALPASSLALAPAVHAAKPVAATCRALRPPRYAPASGTTVRHGDLRVVGIQYDQQVANVVSYASFRRAMTCLVKELVVPHEKRGEPTLAVFNEDIGLMTLATGARGATVRAQAESALRAPAGDAEPVSAALALGELNAAYSPQVAAYQSMFGPIDARKEVLVAATDTFVRAFDLTFSNIARRFGIYVVASNNEPRYRETHDPLLVREFGDPSIPKLRTAYVATSATVHNTTFLWGPRDVHPHAPDGARNLLFRNYKVPLTSLETTILGLDEGPSTGAAGRRNAAGYVVAGHRLGFATSLPAFSWGYPYGRRPAHFHPCRNLAVSYMPCMSKLGVDTVIQAEANPGRWAGDGGGGYWQPLEWMGSAWRAVTDPTVSFRYAVNPMMVGNLLDLDFDGQSAILARGHRGLARSYVGDSQLDRADGDPGVAKVYAGGKPQFVALAPWVRPDGSRAALRAEGATLAAGSRSPQEDDYLETAVYADLTPNRGRST